MTMTTDLRDSVEIRPLRTLDALVIADAFDAIGWHKPAEQYVRYVQEGEYVPFDDGLVRHFTKDL
jgi:hypothetical protein